MTPNEYQKAAKRTESDSIKAYQRVQLDYRSDYSKSRPDPRSMRLIHGLFGLTSESGEIADALKRWLFYEPYEETCLREFLFEEIGEALDA